MRVRRVVTGHDCDGTAVFASDEEVDPASSPADLSQAASTSGELAS